jgi:hypothetical protein
MLLMTWLNVGAKIPPFRSCKDWRALQGYFLRHKSYFSQQKKHIEEVTFSHTWRALQITSRDIKILPSKEKKHNGGSNFVSKEVTLCRGK